MKRRRLGSPEDSSPDDERPFCAGIKPPFQDSGLRSAELTQGKASITTNDTKVNHKIDTVQVRRSCEANHGNTGPRIPEEPVARDQVVTKYRTLTGPVLGGGHTARIEAAIRNLRAGHALDEVLFAAPERQRP